MVDEKTIHLHRQMFWLYGAVAPQTNEMFHMSLYLTLNEQTR